MRGLMRYILAGASIGGGLLALRVSRQIDRDLRSVFSMTAEDLP